MISKLTFEKNTDLYMTIYSLQILHIRGISIPDTVQKSVLDLLHWYEMSNDIRYIEIAALQLKALAHMGLMRECDAEIYKKVALLAGWTEEECKYGFIQKQIKINKTQIRSMIKKWRLSI